MPQSSLIGLLLKIQLLAAASIPMQFDHRSDNQSHLGNARTLPVNTVPNKVGIGLHSDHNRRHINQWAMHDCMNTMGGMCDCPAYFTWITIVHHVSAATEYRWNNWNIANNQQKLFNSSTYVHSCVHRCHVVSASRQCAFAFGECFLVIGHGLSYYFKYTMRVILFSNNDRSIHNSYYTILRLFRPTRLQYLQDISDHRSMC